MQLSSGDKNDQGKEKTKTSIGILPGKVHEWDNHNYLLK